MPLRLLLRAPCRRRAAPGCERDGAGQPSGQAGRCHCEERERGRAVGRRKPGRTQRRTGGCLFFFFFFFLNYFLYLKLKLIIQERSTRAVVKFVAQPAECTSFPQAFRILSPDQEAGSSSVLPEVLNVTSCRLSRFVVVWFSLFPWGLCSQGADSFEHLTKKF